jgi:FkbH-like protein
MFEAGNRVASGTKLPHVQAKITWREIQSRFAAGETADITIGIAASFTAEPLVPMLGAALLQRTLKPQIVKGEYNQIFQTCLDYRSQFGSADPNVIALLWRIEDLLAPELWDFITGTAGALARACEKIGELCRAVAHLRSTYKGMIICSLPPFPQSTPADLLDIDNPESAGLFHRTLLVHATEHLREIGQVRLLDLDALQRQFGAAASFDARKWYLYKQPYTEPFLWEMGSLLGRLIAANLVAPKKCVVFDADNTLWGGVVGEDGLHGIAIGEDFPGSAYRDLQRYMLYLRSKGVLLAIVSKNNEADVWEVFDRHDEMKLKREHISAWRINWRHKSANIPIVAAELNIGTDTLVFVDDNPFEIEQVRTAVPDVTCLQVEEEPARILEALKRAQLFDKLEVTAEDAKRADMLRLERARSVLGEKLSPEAFTAALELKLSVSVARLADVGRVTQLINKTNQFNLTTVRRTQEEVLALLGSPGWRVYALRVSDRFGEYGLVGVAILQVGEHRRWRLDTLLMSCRVLGRSVETSFLAALAKYALAEGAEICDAAFIPTAKNAPAANFLQAHGFTALGGHEWQAKFADVCSVPDSVGLILDPSHAEPAQQPVARS